MGIRLPNQANICAYSLAQGIREYQKPRESVHAVPLPPPSSLFLLRSSVVGVLHDLQSACPLESRGRALYVRNRRSRYGCLGGPVEPREETEDRGAEWFQGGMLTQEAREEEGGEQGGGGVTKARLTHLDSVEAVVIPTATGRLARQQKSPPTPSINSRRTFKVHEMNRCSAGIYSPDACRRQRAR